jgi:hypothetical protein
MSGPYDLPIKITAVDGMSPILRVIASHLLGINRSFEKMSANAKMALGGGLAVFGGVEALKGIWALAQGSKELLNQQEQLERAGVSHLDVLNLTAEAYERIAKAVPTAAASEILKTVREMRAVTGKDAAGLEAAMVQTPKSLMVDALLSNTFGTGKHGEYYKLLRSAEMKGIATDAKKREEFTDAAFSYITAFGGKLTAQDYQTFARRGGAAFMNADVQKSMGPLSVLMADLGGQAAGTAAMTLQQLQVGAGVMSKQQAKVWEDAGLLDLSKAHATGFGGGKLQLDPGAIKGSLETIGNLPEWIEKYIRPALMKLAGGITIYMNPISARGCQIGTLRNLPRCLAILVSWIRLKKTLGWLDRFSQFRRLIKAMLTTIRLASKPHMKLKNRACFKRLERH